MPILYIACASLLPPAMLLTAWGHVFASLVESLQSPCRLVLEQSGGNKLFLQ